MDPAVLIILFLWAVIATGLSLRAVDRVEEEQARNERERSLTTFWIFDANWERQQKERHYAAELTWFARTRFAHARRKRLQLLTDRLFARMALDGIEMAMAEGTIDTLTSEREDLIDQVTEYEKLTIDLLKMRDAAVARADSTEAVNKAVLSQRDSAVARAAELGEETTLLLAERDRALEDRERFVRMISAAKRSASEGIVAKVVADWNAPSSPKRRKSTKKGKTS